MPGAQHEWCEVRERAQRYVGQDLVPVCVARRPERVRRVTAQRPREPALDGVDINREYGVTGEQDAVPRAKERRVAGRVTRSWKTRPLWQLRDS
jgi:hypothetical protein